MRFRCMFLVPMERSGIGTSDRRGSVFKVKSISCRIFDFSGLGDAW
jgi:hypothetical protein